MNCYSCQAETSNGLALCEMCQMKGSIVLEQLPIYFRNLARWRPGKAGARPVPASRPPAGVGQANTDRVSMALDEAGNDITTWARMLTDDRTGGEIPASNDESSSVRVACWFLGSNLTSVATLEWCGDMLDNLGAHEAKLRKLTEAVAPGWYAGECGKCAAATFVIPGLTWVKCQTCGSTTYARDHLETIVTEARDWVARPKALAEAIVALVDTEQSVVRLYERIRKWGQRGEGSQYRGIVAVRRLDRDGDPIGAKSYRLGDVLDLLANEGETRAVSSVERAS